MTSEEIKHIIQTGKLSGYLITGGFYALDLSFNEMKIEKNEIM